MAYAKGLTGREYTELLRADFAHLENARNVINGAFNKLALREYNSAGGEAGTGMGLRQWTVGMMSSSIEFGDIFRKEVGKALAIVANKAKQKVPANKSGLDRGVGYGVFKKNLGGSVTILDVGGRGRKESVKRVWSPGTKKPRFYQKRTQDINEYYGRDRAFILRILNSGTDVRMAKSPLHGRGTGATWGRRGAIAPIGFFHTLGADMERAAQELGETLTTRAEDFIDKAFTEI